MPAKKYRINLNNDEREALEAIRSRGSHSSQKYKRALILLLSDESQGEKRSDSDVAECVGVNIKTVERLRQRCHVVGPLKSLEFKPHAPRTDLRKMTGDLEAKITQIACSEAPDGCSHWTISLLASTAVARGLVDSLAPASVQRLLKKVNLPHGKMNIGVSPKKKTPPS